MLTDDLIDVFVVDGMTMEEVEKQLRKFKESVKIVNTFHPPSERFSGLIYVANPNNHRSFADLQQKRDQGLNLTPNGTTNSMSSETPIIHIHNQAPPAISVVTFRWDSNTSKTGAPDRYREAVYIA